jgi:hypothetical protein
MAHYIIKFALAFLFFMVAISAASPENQPNPNGNSTSSGETINTLFDNLGDILFSFIRIVFGVLIFGLLFMLVRWIKRDDYETLVLPFEMSKVRTNLMEMLSLIFLLPNCRELNKLMAQNTKESKMKI